MTSAPVDLPRVIPLRFTLDDLRGCWHVAEPLIRKACEHSGGRYDPPSVVNAIAAGQMTLLGVAMERDLRALIVACHQVWPTGLRTAEVVLMGAEEGAGRLEDECWDALIDVTVRWAHEMGSDRLVAHGRSGFKRRLKARGLDARVVSELLETDL